MARFLGQMISSLSGNLAAEAEPDSHFGEIAHIENTPLWTVKWKLISKSREKKRRAALRIIEQRRRDYSFRSGKGLPGIVFDDCARLSEPPQKQYDLFPKEPVPDFQGQIRISTQVLCEAT